MDLRFKCASTSYSHKQVPGPQHHVEVLKLCEPGSGRSDVVREVRLFCVELKQ